jgi:hypothetical protein
MLSRLAEILADVRRADLSTPGYHHLPLPSDLSSRELRIAMITVGDHLIARMREHPGIPLDYFSLGRVDQKRSTRIHLDGAPPKSILILGYEPSPIPSAVAVVDYARYCRDHGLSTHAFLSQYNPLYADGEVLHPYVTTVADFDPALNNLIVINNSSCDCGIDGMCGVMHRAEVGAGAGPRVINTVNIADLTGTGQHALDEMDKVRFVELTKVDVSYGG